jgi:hypothetical protein
MKRTLLYISLLLLIEPVAFAQSRGTKGATDQSWQQFYTAFRTAVRKRDRITLKQLMSTNFEWAADGNVNAAEAINYIDQGLVSWQKILKSANGGVINCKSKDSSCWNFSGAQAKRTIKPNWLVFELGSDGRWRWVRLVGD